MLSIIFHLLRISRLPCGWHHKPNVYRLMSARLGIRETLWYAFIWEPHFGFLLSIFVFAYRALRLWLPSLGYLGVRVMQLTSKSSLFVSTCHPPAGCLDIPELQSPLYFLPDCKDNLIMSISLVFIVFVCFYDRHDTTVHVVVVVVILLEA